LHVLWFPFNKVKVVESNINQGFLLVKQNKELCLIITKQERVFTNHHQSDILLPRFALFTRPVCNQARECLLRGQGGGEDKNDK